MKLRLNALVDAVVEVLNASTRPPALYPLARVKYPYRELQPKIVSDGTIVLRCALYGYEYKRRHPRPKAPPAVDPSAIKEAFNIALSPRFAVLSVEARETEILMILEDISWITSF